MRKNTQTKLSKKLIKYSALSLALGGIANASGQVVFTDVDPDFEGGLNDSFAIDFDDDGVDDVIIAQTDIYVRANGNVVGSGSGGVYYASNLSEGTLISAGNSFQSYGDLCYSGGFPNSFCATGPEGFLGVQFDISGETHFGWVQVAGIDSENFILLGFAYEQTPGVGIEAGDGILSLEDNTIEGLTSFVANDVLTINARNPLENITIHNVNGQVVASQKLASTTETVDLNVLSTGVYIATVQSEGRLKAIKFVK